eukprot:761314-Hanusia_phi.AAC.1
MLDISAQGQLQGALWSFAGLPCSLQPPPGRTSPFMQCAGELKTHHRVIGNAARHPIDSCLDVSLVAGEIDEGDNLGAANKSSRQQEKGTARPFTSPSQSRCLSWRVCCCS